MQSSNQAKVTVISDLQCGEQFVFPYDQQAYIKCDHVMRLNDDCVIEHGVGLYTGKVTPFFDHELIIKS